MRKLKYLLMFILSMALLNSCFEDTTDLDLNGEGSNLAGFANTKEIISAIASGAEYTFELNMKVVGPTSMNLTNDVTVTVGVSDVSTAIEGTHYRIDNATTTLKHDNNSLGKFTFTMLTDGIEAPLDVSPVLVLQATGVTGDGNVIASGKPVEITLNYACFSDLAGTYKITLLRDGAVITPYEVVEITETGVGEYRTSEVGHWPASALGGTPGFTFYDVCGVITVPGQNLVDLYSNWVEGFVNGSVDPETGVIHLVYKITSSWESEYDCTYEPM